MTNIVKQAFDAGVHQALADFGLVKVSGGNAENARELANWRKNPAESMRAERELADFMKNPAESMRARPRKPANTPGRAAKVPSSSTPWGVASSPPKTELGSSLDIPSVQSTLRRGPSFAGALGASGVVPGRAAKVPSEAASSGAVARTPASPLEAPVVAKR